MVEMPGNLCRRNAEFFKDGKIEKSAADKTGGGFCKDQTGRPEVEAQ
ncbi:MAG TPA: hypothetical protein O0X38_05835 [Methanocorpusculum sp.]|nr:hypothetical protein [Methanocorpusculum sp.]